MKITELKRHQIKGMMFGVFPFLALFVVGCYDIGAVKMVLVTLGVAAFFGSIFYGISKLAGPNA